MNRLSIMIILGIIITLVLLLLGDSESKELVLTPEYRINYRGCGLNLNYQKPTPARVANSRVTKGSNVTDGNLRQYN